MGKTTTAVNLAAALGTLGKRSLIVDPTPTAAPRCFGIPSESYCGSYEVLLGDEDPISVVLTTDAEEGIEMPWRQPDPVEPGP